MYAHPHGRTLIHLCDFTTGSLSRVQQIHSPIPELKKTLNKCSSMVTSNQKKNQRIDQISGPLFYLFYKEGSGGHNTDGAQGLYFWLCAQRVFLEVLRRSFALPKTEPGWRHTRLVLLMLSGPTAFATIV